MFKLVTISERVAIAAVHFGERRECAYAHALNTRYANRVLRNIGLVIGVWRIQSIGAETLQMGCGRAVADVIYRLVVFAPFVGEAVWATIGGASKEVLLLALPFFGAMRVSPAHLPPGTAWDGEERVWVWRPDRVELFLDLSNDVVARVTDVQYAPAADKPPSAASAVVAPMRIAAALTDAAVPDSQGLGDPLWWYEEEQEGAAAVEGAPLEEDALIDEKEEEMY